MQAIRSFFWDAAVGGKSCWKQLENKLGMGRRNFSEQEDERTRDLLIT